MLRMKVSYNLILYIISQFQVNETANKELAISDISWSSNQFIFHKSY